MADFILEIGSGVFLVGLFIFGISVGSFLTLVADRLPRRRPILRGRSRCDNCAQVLRWYELIPVLSFLLQKGRCRRCKSRLSLRYPLVELFTGLLTVILWQRVLAGQSVFFTQDSFLLPLLFISTYWLFLTYALWVILLVDLKDGIIPDKILGLILLVLVLVLGLNKFAGPCLGWPLLGSLIQACPNVQGESNLLVALAATLLFLLLVLITRGRGMGLGDVKFVFLIGLLLGWPKTLVALYLAFLAGALSALVLIALKRKKFGQTIPFGPFLAAATWLTLLWGEQFLTWYLTFVRAIQ